MVLLFPYKDTNRVETTDLYDILKDGALCLVNSYYLLSAK